jgi:endogenous inhibitor of DNA gyrase (YacG/DUF329 family)
MDDPMIPAKPCPTCGKPAVTAKYRPFCSARCKQVDLGRWFSGTYRVETEEDPDMPSGRDEE